MKALTSGEAQCMIISLKYLREIKERHYVIQGCPYVKMLDEEISQVESLLRSQGFL